MKTDKSVSTLETPNKLMSIQYVRGAASVIVVGWHTGWSYTVLGQSGVDFFFVVSGFVMMLISRLETSPVRFQVARVFRIAPLYWGVTLVVALKDHPSASKIWTSLIFWPSGGFPLVIQGWSLNLEMVYYLLFALTLLASVQKRLRLLALEFIVLCTLLPLLAPQSEVVATWSNPLAFEFLAGAGLHAAWRRRLLPVGTTAWVAAIIAAFALGMSHLLGSAPDGWLRVAFWGVPALTLIGAGLGIESAGQLPRIKLLALLGEASYAIYLTHPLALLVVFEPLHLLYAPLALPIAIVWACFVGYFAHRAVDDPLHRLTSATLRRIWPKPQF